MKMLKPLVLFFLLLQGSQVLGMHRANEFERRIKALEEELAKLKNNKQASRAFYADKLCQAGILQSIILAFAVHRYYENSSFLDGLKRGTLLELITLPIFVPLTYKGLKENGILN